MAESILADSGTTTAVIRLILQRFLAADDDSFCNYEFLLLQSVIVLGYQNTA